MKNSFCPLYITNFFGTLNDNFLKTLSTFWWGAAMLQMGLLVYGKTGLGLSATGTGTLLCAAAVGIVVGQIVAGFVDKTRFLLGSVLLTGWIASALLAILYFVPLSPVCFAVVLGVLAFDLGFFKLPFDAEIQKVVRGPKLNTTGLWGSIWSRANRNTSPEFEPTFIKSVLLWFFWSPFVRRRRVRMHVEDITSRVVEWSKLSRLEFNARLNEWYNTDDL